MDDKLYIHTPVLLNEVLKYLTPEDERGEGCTLIDCTLGEGGHSEAFLSKYPLLNVIGIDADSCIMKVAKIRLQEYSARMHYYNCGYLDFLSSYPGEDTLPNLILFDLGISVFHYIKAGRGFSFREHNVLDMRLNTQDALRAVDILNTWTMDELSALFYFYGQERYSRRIATAIVKARASSPLVYADDFASLIYDCVPAGYRQGHLHPATKAFQALRIYVNDELNNVKKALHKAFNLLVPGGLLAVITFHSLEDRIVKHYFTSLTKQCICPPNLASCQCENKVHAEFIVKKPVTATEEECKNNAPSRSAKLRVIKKLANAGEIYLENPMYKADIPVIKKRV